MAGDVITLADVALTTNPKTLVGAFVQNLIRKSKVMSDIPFVSKNALSVIVNKWKTLPAIQRRDINEGYNDVKGVTEQETWAPRFYGGNITIDRQLEKLEDAFQDETSLQTDMFIAGLTADWTYDFISNTPLINAKGMFGLTYLVSNFQASKMQMFVDSSADNTGTALDVTASSANEHKFLNALHRALKYVGAEKGGKVCIYMNEALYLGVSAVLRAAGLLSVTTDQFDRTFNTFSGFPLYDVGLKSDQSTEIIGVTEGTGAASTSLYVARWDKSDGLIGVQKGSGLDVYDPLGGREMESKPAHMLRVDWGTMIVPVSDYCVARVGGIKNPASWTVPI